MDRADLNLWNGTLTIGDKIIRSLALSPYHKPQLNLQQLFVTLCRKHKARSLEEFWEQREILSADLWEDWLGQIGQIIALTCQITECRHFYFQGPDLDELLDELKDRTVFHLSSQQYHQLIFQK